MPILLNTPIESAARVHRRIIPALKRLGIRTLRDLLFHFPLRYDDFSNEKNIAGIFPGETVTVRGVIEKISVHQTFRKRMALTEAVVRDETGKIKVVWFNQPFLAKNLKEGFLVRLSGKVAKGPGGVYLQNPSYERVGERERAIHTGGLVAVYPETQGITSRWLRYLVSNFIKLRQSIADPIPPDILKRNNLPRLSEALFAIHFPKTQEEARGAERRFVFEDLFMIQLRALRERMALKKERAPQIPLDVPRIKEFVGSLAFGLTDAQRRSLWEIANDLAKPSPMNRILEGDVGSGKTVVAAAALFLVVRAGFRAVFMAPTEILARQHLHTLERLFAPFGISVGYRTGAEKRAVDSHIVVGTHALIQKGVAFDSLGLVIIDEQHRFGVDARAHLIKKGSGAFLPHFLSMSATPIPRTLALTIYGDLDVSLLDEMPKSRKPIITKVIDPKERNSTYEFIRREVKKGRQVFVICPRIDMPDEPKVKTERAFQQQLLLADVKSVKEEYKKLSTNIFPDLKVAMLHGKMPAKSHTAFRRGRRNAQALGGKSKEEVMKDFRDGKIDILVSTSVVEVGVDIPNASVMMIEGAERFGLAQLHQ